MVHRPTSSPRGDSLVSRGMSVTARRLSKEVAAGIPVLQDVSLDIAPGEVVAIVGGSGAGKSTLLDALAGICPADSGRVMFDTIDVYKDRAVVRSIVGYVPQDDIIHLELPLERTLRYAAALRLPAGTTSDQISTRVRDVMATLGLEQRADTRVGALSGGQRKRASIAVEMLTRPRVFFLDEPTSGLDPSTSAELLRTLRGLGEHGATIVFTTHAMQDLVDCDRVVFLGRGGRVVFVGGLDDACRRFGVSSPHEIYAYLDEAEALPPEGERGPPAEVARDAGPTERLPGPVRQWSVLTARAFETIVRNRLTLAILIGSPLMVIAMFVILFRAGAFDPRTPDATSVLMIIFWITFGSFFFGLTYGLLQIVTERPIVRREYLVGLRLGPYLFSKVTVLLPFLVAVNLVMLVVLRALDRLPRLGLGTYGVVAVTLGLGAAAALMLGLLASASVDTASQATLALPMLCFPAVLFSGAILPVAVMAPVGRWISTIVPVRWAFEAVGRDLETRSLLLGGESALGPALVASYGDAGSDPTGVYWSYLVGFTVVFFGLSWVVLRRKLGRSPR